MVLKHCPDCLISSRRHLSGHTVAGSVSESLRVIVDYQLLDSVSQSVFSLEVVLNQSDGHVGGRRDSSHRYAVFASFGI